MQFYQMHLTISIAMQREENCQYLYLHEIFMLEKNGEYLRVAQDRAIFHVVKSQKIKF